MKTNDFRGDLTDISAKKETLPVTPVHATYAEEVWYIRHQPNHESEIMRHTSHRSSTVLRSLECILVDPHNTDYGQHAPLLVSVAMTDQLY